MHSPFSHRNGQAAGCVFDHMPPVQSCGMPALHCLAPSVHAPHSPPVQVPGGQVPESPHMPLGPQSWVVLPLQRFAPGVHSPEHCMAPSRHTKAQATPAPQVPSPLQVWSWFPTQRFADG
jgi:hypothetical protein